MVTLHMNALYEVVVHCNIMWWWINMDQYPALYWCMRMKLVSQMPSAMVRPKPLHIPSEYRISQYRCDAKFYTGVVLFCATTEKVK